MYSIDVNLAMAVDECAHTEKKSASGIAEMALHKFLKERISKSEDHKRIEQFLHRFEENKKIHPPKRLDQYNPFPAPRPQPRAVRINREE